MRVRSRVRVGVRGRGRPRHRSGGLVVGVDDRAAVKVVGRQLLEAVVEDLAAVPTVDAIVVDDRLAERLEGVLHLGRRQGGVVIR